MALRRVKVLGPNFGSFRHWAIGITAWACLATFVAFEVGSHTPTWTREAGSLLFIAYLVGGSTYLARANSQGTKLRGTELGMYPKSWRRWILDEGDGSPRKR